MAYLYWDELLLPSFGIQKTRSQPNPRRETDVFDGPLRVELMTDPEDVPAIFDCSVICRNQYQTSAVGAFFRYINQNDSMLFYKDLPTEYGMQKHLVRITGGIPQPDPGTTRLNSMMKYSFTVYVEEVVVPESIENNPLLYAKFGIGSKTIDLVVSSILTEG